MEKFKKMYWVAMAISLLANPVVVHAAATDQGGTTVQVQGDPVAVDQTLMRSLMKADQRKAAAARAAAARAAVAATQDATAKAKETK